MISISYFQLAAGFAMLLFAVIVAFGYGYFYAVDKIRKRQSRRPLVAADDCDHVCTSCVVCL